MAENDDEAQTQHQLTQAQLEAIENEIKSTQPLTSPLLPISVLLQQYTSSDGDGDGGSSDSGNNGQQQNKGFLQSATFLSKKYASLRKIRGDGNCYYRAFLYSLCEHLLRSLILNNNSNDKNNIINNNAQKEFSRIKEIVSKSLKWVCQYGYDEYTIDMFYEELVELFDFIEEVSKSNQRNKSDAGDDDNDGTTGNNNNTNNTEDLLASASKQLHARLNEENACSDYCTWFMRVMTSAQMKSSPDQYLPFVMAEDYMDVPAFCSREVEPMGKECGMVQVSALAECMGVKVVIEYMDGRGGDVHHHVFGEGGDGADKVEDDGRTCVTLLYRPGHYDILY